MKNKLKTSIFLCVLALILVCSLTACNNDKKIFLTIDGDIESSLINVDLNDYKTCNFDYEKNGSKQSASGWNLKSILNDAKTLYKNNHWIVTSDNGSALVVNDKIKEDIYITEKDRELYFVAPKKSDAIVKRFSEITITKSYLGGVEDGIKIVFPVINDSATLHNDPTTIFSQGLAKMMLYEADYSLEEASNNILQYKLKENFTIKDLSYNQKNIAYFEDFDIVSNANDLKLGWNNGKLCAKVKNEMKPLLGIVTSTNQLNYDVYNIMKDCIDNNEKVMYILVDGYSWQQANLYKDKLNVLKIENNAKKSFSVVSTTNIAKSEVALSSIITGKSPYYTGVTSKKDKNLLIDDIFGYAKSKGISLSYIEGNHNLINTDVQPILTTPDLNGFTDEAVYNKTLFAIDEGKDFIFTHFHGVDDQNHMTGPVSEEALAKLIETDFFIKNIAESFDGKILIGSDHGHYNYQSGDETKGNHGTFNCLDMYTPLICIEK